MRDLPILKFCSQAFPSRPRHLSSLPRTPRCGSPPGGWGVYLHLRWASRSHRNPHQCYPTHPSLCRQGHRQERVGGGSRHRAILVRGRPDTRTIFLRKADCFPKLFGEHTHTQRQLIKQDKTSLGLGEKIQELSLFYDLNHFFGE